MIRGLKVSLLLNALPKAQVPYPVAPERSSPSPPFLSVSSEAIWRAWLPPTFIPITEEYSLPEMDAFLSLLCDDTLSLASGRSLLPSTLGKR